MNCTPCIRSMKLCLPTHATLSAPSVRAFGACDCRATWCAKSRKLGFLTVDPRTGRVMMSMPIAIGCAKHVVKAPRGAGCLHHFETAFDLIKQTPAEA